ncbi:hypothetical protein [Neisseria musculi]|uniref:hypothetical protein n=1 Tax=Neisseria musculi TaxID=1815583 RepID=UPI003F8819BC
MKTARRPYERQVFVFRRLLSLLKAAAGYRKNLYPAPAAGWAPLRIRRGVPLGKLFGGRLKTARRPFESQRFVFRRP